MVLRVIGSTWGKGSSFNLIVFIEEIRFSLKPIIPIRVEENLCRMIIKQYSVSIVMVPGKKEVPGPCHYVAQGP